MTRNRLDLTGQPFFRLVALAETRHQDGRRAWRCRCTCGRELVVATSPLRAGAVRSCGCATRESARAKMTTHGGSYSAEYVVWRGHLNRARHGGPSLCKAWQRFDVFLRDVGPRPTPSSRLRRYSLKRGFSPSNAGWIPKQSNRVIARVERVRPRREVRA